MSRLVQLVLADRARRRGLGELAVGRRRAREARRILEELDRELGGRRSRHATDSRGDESQRLAAETAEADATPAAIAAHPTNG